MDKKSSTPCIKLHRLATRRSANPSKMEWGQNWLPGLQNWMQRLRHAFPPTVSHKASSAALVLSVSSCLPVYLVHVVLLFISQYAFSAPSLLLARHTSTIPGHSLLVYLFFSPPLPCVQALPFVQPAPPVVGNAEEEVPGGFLPASSREGF